MQLRGAVGGNWGKSVAATLGGSTIFINFYTRVNDRVIANFYMIADKYMGKNFSVVPQFHIFSQVKNNN